MEEEIIKNGSGAETLKKKNSLKSIVKGGAVLGICAILVKIIGALYRVPLTNLLGGEGIGLYQMSFPVYSLLLDFSGAGLPLALSKIIASKKPLSPQDRDNYARTVLKDSVKMFAVFGAIGTLVMAVFSSVIATFQGDGRAAACYLALSPSVTVVAVISCLRGYFQGLNKMAQTGVSQIIEQVVKLVFGIAVVSVLLPDITAGAGGAAFAVTVSEIFALAYLFISYKKSRRTADGVRLYAPAVKLADDREARERRKNILKYVLPISLTGIALPLSQVIDSFVFINLMSAYRSDATALYGLFSGSVASILNLPVALCYGVAVSCVPTLSSLPAKEREIGAKKTLMLTLFSSLLGAAAVYTLSGFSVNLLFPRLSGFEKSTATELLKVTSGAVVFLSLIQTENALLIASDRPFVPVINMCVGIVLKTALSVVLISDPDINVYGGAISLIACYFCVCLLNLIVIAVGRTENGNKKHKLKRQDYRK